jgi:hypothetical protein
VPRQWDVVRPVQVNCLELRVFLTPLGCRKLAPEASCSSGLETVDLVLGKQSAANSVAGSSFLMGPTGPSPRRFSFGFPSPCADGGHDGM